MSSLRAITTLSLLTPLLASCGAGDQRSTPSAEARDSAGITIVENIRPEWGRAAQWQISNEPSLEIGLLDGPSEYQFERIADAIQLRDGKIIIADAGAHTIRFYDELGGYLTAAGGKGGGPGEFESLNTLVPLPGDSVGVWDTSAKRLTIFDAEGRLGRVLSVTEVPGFLALLHGSFDDGSILISPGEDVQELMSREPGEYRATALYLRYSSTGEFIDTLLIAPGEEKIAFREGSSFGNRPLLFSRGHKVTLGGQQIYEGVNDEYRIMVRPVGERPERIVTRIGELRQVESAELEEAVRKMTEGRVRRQGELAEMLGTSSAAARKPDIPHRDSYPAFNRLLIDSEDHLWVQAYPVPGEAHHEWSVFDPAGYWLGDLQVPASLHIYQIGSDFILGRWQDEFEVHYIRIYELTRGEMAETAPDPPATDREIMEVLPNVQSRLENALQKLDRLYPTSYLPPVTIAGDVAYSHLPELVRGREQEIETAFLEAHDQRDLSAWVYNTFEAEIGDLGYWVGYRIAKAYYQTATAKDRALREILEMTDAREFLAESGWRPGLELAAHDSSYISDDD